MRWNDGAATSAVSSMCHVHASIFAYVSRPCVKWDPHIDLLTTKSNYTAYPMTHGSHRTGMWDPPPTWLVDPTKLTCGTHCPYKRDLPLTWLVGPTILTCGTHGDSYMCGRWDLSGSLTCIYSILTCRTQYRHAYIYIYIFNNAAKIGFLGVELETSCSPQSKLTTSPPHVWW